MIIRMGIGNNGEEYVIKTVELDLSNMDAVSSQLGLLCFVYSGRGFTPSHLFLVSCQPRIHLASSEGFNCPIVFALKSDTVFIPCCQGSRETCNTCSPFVLLVIIC